MEQFPYSVREDVAGSPDLLPYLPLSLARQQTVAVVGLLDTGATVNVLPFSVGLQLGAVWEQQTAALQLVGNLAAYEA
jgi:hypothetical protein